jgi:hypothetical protein
MFDLMLLSLIPRIGAVLEIMFPIVQGSHRKSGDIYEKRTSQVHVHLVATSRC